MVDSTFKAFVDSEIRDKMSEQFTADANAFVDSQLKTLGYEGAMADYLRPLVLCFFMEGQQYGVKYMIEKISKGMNLAA